MNKHSKGTDMTTERPDGTQGDLESSKAPAEPLHHQFIAALTYYADMVKAHPEKAHSLLNEGMVILEKAVTAYAATVEREAIERLKSHSREYGVTDVELIEHHGGFLEAVDIAVFDKALAALQGPIQGDAPDQSELSGS